MATQIFVAVVHHAHGQDAYAAKSKDGLDKQIAGFAESWADDVESHEGDPGVVRKLYAEEKWVECWDYYFKYMEDRETVDFFGPAELLP